MARVHLKENDDFLFSAKIRKNKKKILMFETRELKLRRLTLSNSKRYGLFTLNSKYRGT